jgi:hypothetical protein
MVLVVKIWGRCVRVEGRKEAGNWEIYDLTRRLPSDLVGSHASLGQKKEAWLQNIFPDWPMLSVYTGE